MTTPFLDTDSWDMFSRLLETPRLALVGAALLLVGLLGARPVSAAARLRRLPGFVVLGVVAVLATGTIAVAASQQKQEHVRVPASAPRTPAVLVVPDVEGEAYVFAKGMLEDGGFAWRVEGDVEGYAGNRVASQSPKAGTRVVDNGAPTVTLTLARESAKAERGTPANASPYHGTAIRLASAARAERRSSGTTSSKR